MAKLFGVIAVFLAGHDLTDAPAEEQRDGMPDTFTFTRIVQRLDQIAGECHGAGRSAQ